MKPSKLSLIRQASRTDLPASAWRDSLDLWLRLNYGMPSPEARALRKGTVDSYLGFQFVRTQLKPAPLKPKAYSFALDPLLVAVGRPIRKARRRRTLPASFFREEFARHFDRPLIGNVRVPRPSPIAGIEPR